MSFDTPRCRNSREGIILIDKPDGPTSHDIVDFVRKRFRFRKAGHAGTLDPMATGLLIILLGAFTKKSARFSNYDKEYKAVFCLGISTDTGDKEGNIVERKNLDLKNLTVKNIEKVFEHFCGEIRQVPPMYSAKKIKGKKLYELARRGMVLRREPKVVFINEIKLLNVSLPYVTIYVKCSKGTYIRQLAHDIGEKIGCGAHLASLVRTRIGPFDVQDAVPFGQLGAGRAEEIFYENILQPE
ncbi:MAG: tRNA pseudouridine(55) synthase TruB [Candidatus Omnitrophota bacterium]|nr:MAG: tRNA pseudouridine(55) synthase TruB [Candidatus Omnitrophota bacterium]